MAANKSSVLFNGGRKIKLKSSNSQSNVEGIKMTKNADDDSWTINITAVIKKEEAEDVIFKFSDLNPRVPPGSTFEEAFPNMLYFPGFDSNGKPTFVKFAANSELLPFFDRDLGGSITLKLNVVGLAKTQNPKTQNTEI